MIISYSRVIDNVQVFKKEDIKHIPKTAGCYLFFNKEFQCIYIGESENLKARVKSSLRKHSGDYEPRATSAGEFIFLILEPDETERVILEMLLVQRFAPLFNILGTSLSEKQRLDIQAVGKAAVDIEELKRMVSLEHTEESPE